MPVDVRVGVEVRPGVDDVHGVKAGGGEASLEVFDADGTGDAAHVRHDVARQVRGELLLQRDVAHRDTPAGLEHAEHLAEDGLFVRGQVDDAIRDDARRALNEH